MISRRSGARVLKIMRQVFGLAELRPGQQAALAKRQTLARAKIGRRTVEFVFTITCDNCRGVSTRSEAVAEGAA